MGTESRLVAFLAILEQLPVIAQVLRLADLAGALELSVAAALGCCLHYFVREGFVDSCRHDGYPRATPPESVD
jgi:hypothetical protein